MGLMNTLAKMAIGYAAARGVEKLAGGKGLGGMLGGAQVPAGKARAQQAPGMDQLNKLMGQLTGGSGMGGLQEMMQNLAKGSGLDLSALAGASGASGRGGRGMLSSLPSGTGGLAGIMGALGGSAAMKDNPLAGMMKQFGAAAPAPKQAEDSAALLLRAMIQAAKSDGDIDDAERDKIIETVGEDADADDIAFVQEQLAAPLDPEALAADTPDMLKVQVYSMSLMPIRVDTPAEADYLDRLAVALGLNQQTVNALHLQMGTQPLYA